MRLQCTGTGPLRIARVDELGHGVQQVLARVDHIQLALQLGEFRLQVGSRPARGGRELPLIGGHFRLNRLALRVDFFLHRIECLRRGSHVVGGFRAARLAAQQLGIGARDLEGKRDDLVGCLPVGIENQQVAGLTGGLLLGSQRPVPLDRFVENLHDLIAGQHGNGGVCRRLRQGGRRSGGAQNARSDSQSEDPGEPKKGRHPADRTASGAKSVRAQAPRGGLPHPLCP